MPRCIYRPPGSLRRPVQNHALLLFFFVLSLPVVVVHGSGICLIQYLLADNNLEQYMRQDLNEFILSPAIRDPSMTTWTYFDSRNFRSPEELQMAASYELEDIQVPLENVWTADGSQLLTDVPNAKKYEGSHYLKFRHDLIKMVVNETLPVELNGEDPLVLQQYLETALTDCIQNDQRTEFFVLFSSHGHGFAGWGDDQNKEPSRGRRRLRQTNQRIVNALKNALAAVPGAPSKYDVIGFDACLMQAADAFDDYYIVTKYYLASEAVEPGHGWAYRNLYNTSSALDLAIQIVDFFIDDPQGVVHLSPKTLSIVNASKYSAFLTAWNDLCGEFHTLLIDQKDASFLAMIHRSRASSIDFQSTLDQSGEQNPAALDIGDFLVRFQAMCDPSDNTVLKTTLEKAIQAYEDLLVKNRFGKGTSAATGVTIGWPHRKNYLENKKNIDYFIFGDPEVYGINGAPNYSKFLKEYFTATTTEASGKQSACSVGAASNATSTGENDLLLNPSLTVVSDNEVLVQSELAISADLAIIEYGVNLRDWIDTYKRPTGQRRLPQKKISPNSRQLFKHPRARRRVQSQIIAEEYFIVFGGDEMGTYEGSVYHASWNRRFYAILYNDNRFDTVYVHDDGEGGKSIPVVYFPPENPVHEQGTIEFGTTGEQGIEELGGRLGFLTFTLNSTTNEPLDNLVLFTVSGTNSTDIGSLYETPREASGSIAPIVSVFGVLNGVEVEYLAGGLNGTVFPWDEDSNLTILSLTDVRYMNYFSAESVIINMKAYNFDVNESEGGIVDSVPFEVLLIGNADPNEMPAEPEPAKGSSSSSADINILESWWLVCGIALLFHCYISLCFI